MIVDRDYCISSFLMFRTIVSDNYSFSEDTKPNLANINFKRDVVKNCDDLHLALKKIMKKETSDGKAALALSGGIDSAILASMMPRGSTAYTLRCVVPDKEIYDESKSAAEIAEIFELNHEIVNITWDDVLSSMEVLMKNKGSPFHSIESQIYKACIKCKSDGFSKMIFGENADIIYGGMDGLLEKDWSVGEYVERYSYILPYKVLKKPQIIMEPFLKYEKNGQIDSYLFTNEFFRREALGTYNNACNSAGIKFIGPYSRTFWDETPDLQRIRKGDSKYVVRELYKKIFADYKMPDKIPMPRATTEWLKKWTGPVRKEFIKNSTTNMSGDQRWMIFCLEKYLDYLDKKKVM